MPQEIERKFLVESDEWRRHSKRPRPIRQGYIVQFKIARTSSKLR